MKLPDNIRTKIIGILIRKGKLDEFKEMSDVKLINYYFELSVYIRNKWLWKMYEKDKESSEHPDVISNEWIVATHKHITESNFDIETFEETFPEELI